MLQLVARAVRARARAGWSGWRAIQPKISTAAPTAPTAPTSTRGGSRTRAGARAASALADRGREQERADEVAAAAVVLLRGALSRLVGADRDVLGAVVGGELAAPQRDGGGGERGERRDGLARWRSRAASGARCRPPRRRDRRRRDARPLEREARLGQRRAARRGARRTPRPAAAGRAGTASSRRGAKRRLVPEASGSSRRRPARPRPTTWARGRGPRSGAPCRRAAASPCG